MERELYMLLLYNDDKHSLESVIEAIQVALSHNEQHAFIIANTVHQSPTGRAVVCISTLEDLNYISNIFREYGLLVEIDEVTEEILARFKDQLQEGDEWKNAN